MDCKQTHTQTKEVEEIHNNDERNNNEMQRLWYSYGDSDKRTMEITEMQQMRQL